MKTKAIKSALTLSAFVIGLSACGGGDDDQAGQQAEFQVSPSEVEITSGTTDCPAIKAGDFLIAGGVAPYTVFSPYHQLVQFSEGGGTAPTHVQLEVSDRNKQFTIYMSGCFDPATVTVQDKLGRTIAIEVSYAASGAN